MTIHEKLKQFAFNVAYPYLLKQPSLEKYLDKITFLLVGSTATGLCTEKSDVDICILCEEDVFNDISKDTNWINGRPTQIVIDGIQLHYYAISTANVLNKIKILDDVTLYVYGTALIMSDPNGLYGPIIKEINNADLKKIRMEKSFDMLISRKRALQEIFESSADSILRIDISVELIKCVLRCIALKDDLQFDSRKRFYQSTLIGQTGTYLKKDMELILSLVGSIYDIKNTEANQKFQELLDYCYNYLLS